MGENSKFTGLQFYKYPPLSEGDMELTAKERNTVLAVCQKNAQECRERASRISFPDLREHAEQTARMWEELAASVAGTSP